MMNSCIRVLANPVALAISFVLYLIFSFVVLPAHAERASVYTPDGAYFDTLYYYSPASVYPFIESFGDAGRRAYICARFSFDLAYPLVYTLFLLSTMSFFQARISLWHGTGRLQTGKRRTSGRRTKNIRMRKLLVLPLLALGFDYLENLSLVFLMTSFPTRFIVVEYLASSFTSLKWLSVALSVVVVCVFMLLWFIFFIKSTAQRCAGKPDT